VALPLAAAGLVTPWIAALGMALSSLVVTATRCACAPVRHRAMAAMNILLLLIPISLVLLGVAVWAFVWAVRRGQFDDLDTPGARHPRARTTSAPAPPRHPHRGRPRCRLTGWCCWPR
jgi:cbb3-type cytochrome oxidase maturation protein